MPKRCGKFQIDQLPRSGAGPWILNRIPLDPGGTESAGKFVPAFDHRFEFLRKLIERVGLEHIAKIVPNFKNRVVGPVSFAARAALQLCERGHTKNGELWGILSSLRWCEPLQRPGQTLIESPE
jgi:hypothetical protein